MKTLWVLVLMLAVGPVAAGLADSKPQEKSGKGAAMSDVAKNLHTATFAGGCFWMIFWSKGAMPGGESGGGEPGAGVLGARRPSAFFFLSTG
jgi:hypothetical protein